MDAVGKPLGSELQVRVAMRLEPRRAAAAAVHALGVAQFPFDDEAQHSAVMTRAALRDACGDEQRRGRHADGRIECRCGWRRGRDPDRATRARPDHQRADRRAHAGAGLHLLPADFNRALDHHAAVRFPADHRAVDGVGEPASRRNRGTPCARLLQGARGRRMCSRSRALLVGAGGVLALPLGMALSVWLDRILKAMPGIPATMHFFVFEPRALLLHAALLVVTALLASALSDVAGRAAAHRDDAAQRGGGLKTPRSSRRGRQQDLPDGGGPGARACAMSR